MDVKKHVKIVRRSTGLEPGAFYAQFPHADQWEQKGDDHPDPPLQISDASEQVDIQKMMGGRPWQPPREVKPLPDED